MRDAGNFRHKTYSVEKMLEGLAKEGGNFTLFGGEPLLTDIDDLETIFKWGYDRYKGDVSVNTLSGFSSQYIFWEGV